MNRNPPPTLDRENPGMVTELIDSFYAGVHIRWRETRSLDGKLLALVCLGIWVNHFDHGPELNATR